MKRRYAVVCAALAVMLLPGALPIAAGVVAVRAIRRFTWRRQAKRIVISHGQRADQWGQA